MRADPLLLVEEISHRVINEYAQAVAGIRLAARQTPSLEARVVLAATAFRLLDYAEAHRALLPPVSAERLDLAEALDRLCATMTVARLQERGVRLTLSSAPVTLASDRCWRVALIVSELITNSLRHGLQNGPGEIRVDIEVHDRSAICRVADDGGTPGCLRPGRGCAVVQGLADELGGLMKWRSDAEGMTAELSFPILAVELGS